MKKRALCFALSIMVALGMLMAPATASFAVSDSSSFDAEINGEKFETIQEAIQAAKENDTIKLIFERDGSELSTSEKLPKIVVDKTLTIDVNGKSLVSQYGYYGVIFAAQNGTTLTVTDSKNSSNKSIQGGLWTEGGDVVVQSDLCGCKFFDKGGIFTINAIQSNLEYHNNKGERAMKLGDAYKNAPPSKCQVLVSFDYSFAMELNGLGKEDVLEDIELFNGPGASEKIADGLTFEYVDNSDITGRYTDGKVFLHKQGSNVYLDGKNGDDSNDGLSESTPVKTFQKAKEVFVSGSGYEGIIVTGTITVSDKETFSLKKDGKTYSLMRGDNFKDSLIKVESQGDLTVKDITIDGRKIKESKSMILVGTEGKLVIDDGALLKGGNCVDAAGGWVTEKGGGAVRARGGEVHMQGGEISGNKALLGGGISVIEKGRLLISGGVLTNNEAQRGSNQAKDPSGGAVYAGRDGHITMTGGLIEDNYADCSGGGISFGSQGYATYTFDDGYKEPNSFEMSGGTINNNESRSCGGGLFVQVNCVANITGGNITNNYAGAAYGYYSGGGIYVNGYADTYDVGVPDGRLNIERADIGNNEARLAGGGVAACPTSELHVDLKNGATIYENSASTGRDVYASISIPYTYVFYLRNLVWLSEYMMNGTPYKWKNDKDELVDFSKLTSAKSMAVHNDFTSESSEIKECVARTKVHITGNYSGSRGGGIGTNGEVFIGEVIQHKVDVPFEKKWKDVPEENRPEKIRVWLLRDGERMVSETIKPDKEGNWKGVFKDQPKYRLDEDGEETKEEYIYSVEEDMDFVIGKTQPEDGSGEEPKDITAGDRYRAKTEKGEDGTLTITNKLREDVTSATAIIEAKKTLDGKAPEGSEFDFELWDEKGNVIESVSNDGGKISFTPIEYNEPGVYKYTIRELPGKNDKIKYDKRVHLATVTVIDDGYDYKASVEYAPEQEPDKILKDGEVPLFENERIPDNPPEEPKVEEPPKEEPEIPEQVTEEQINEDVKKKPNNPPEKEVTDKPAKPNSPSAVKKSSPKVKARTSDTGDHSNTGTVALMGAAALAVMLYTVISSIRRRRL